jgi:hypothetical protein
LRSWTYFKLMLHWICSDNFISADHKTQCPGQLWGPFSLLSNGHWGLFPQE